MKKNTLYIGIAFVLVGLGLLCSIRFADERLQGLLWGFTGATLLPGIGRILQYFYWMRPEKQGEYARRIEQEKIYQQDERNVMLKDRAARYVFLMNIYVISFSLILFSVLGNLEILEGTRTLVLYLGAFQLVNVVSWAVIYSHLIKK